VNAAVFAIEVIGAAGPEVIGGDQDVDFEDVAISLAPRSADPTNDRL
jgi:hypothetical protein